MPDGRLVGVFTTDEHRQSPAEASTGVLYQDLKYLVSSDNGSSWQGPWLIDDGYPIYFPGACIAKNKAGEDYIMVQYLTREGLECRFGRFVDE